MIKPGNPKRDAAAAACRNAQHELDELAERLTQVRNDLTHTTDIRMMQYTEDVIRDAQKACRETADVLYREEGAR